MKRTLAITFARALGFSIAKTPLKLPKLQSPFILRFLKANLNENDTEKTEAFL